MLILKYCGDVVSECGSNEVYANYSTCQTEAANYFIGENIENYAFTQRHTRDTLACRLIIKTDIGMSVQTCTDLKENCVQMPNIADFCADQNYACGTEWGNTKQWNTVPECENDMNNIVTGIYQSDTTQDTLACRLHYLRLAHESKEAAAEICPKITKNSTVCRQQVPSPPPGDKDDEDDNTLIYIIIGSVGGGLLLIGGLYYFCRTSSKKNPQESQPGKLIF